MLKSVELREQARLFMEAAEREKGAQARWLMSLHAAALTKRADDAQREEDLKGATL